MYETQTIDVPSQGISVLKNGKKVLEVLNIGATLNYLCLTDENIIDGYDEKELVGFEWSKSALLFPFPNRLRDGKYEFEGKSYQFPINEPSHQNAIHGFVYKRPFQLVEQQSTETGCVIKYCLTYQGELPYYPFPFELWVTYALASNELNFSIEVINTGAWKLPFGIGWHPYFKFGKKIDSIRMKLPAMQQIALDNRQLPTGNSLEFDQFRQMQRIDKESFDTGFKVAEDGYCVRVQIDSSEVIEFQVDHFSYLQLFTPDDRQRIAIEPMSCGIDVFNSKEGLKLLESGSNELFNAYITCK